MNTKIIATIGPKTQEAEMLSKLASSGANIARLNFTHGTYEWFSDVIQTVHKHNASQHTMAILLDTKGPEIRTAGDFPETQLTSGKTYSLGVKNADITIDYDKLTKLCKVGQLIQLDGGNIQAKVVDKKGKNLLIKMKNSGILKSRKHVNVPGILLDLPILAEKDRQDIKFGIKEGIHCIAASFVSSSKDIAIIRDFISKHTKRFIPVIAKIESQTALDNLDDIIAAADGIMIARGDLAVETSFEVIPVYQKLIIDKCRRMRTPVIMATQMLASMVQSPTPTRAEASDVGNAIYEGVDAIMLSDETTVGDHPTLCVETMRNIAVHVEHDILTKHPTHIAPTPFTDDLGISMLASCKQMALGTNASAIVLKTNRIDYITYLSQERLRQRIIVLTDNEDVFYFCHLLYGVKAVLIDKKTMNSPMESDTARKLLKKRKLAASKENIILFTDNDGSDDTFDALYVAKM